MGVAVSGYKLANTVARLGQLGLVSGTALDRVMVRRLQGGDAGVPGMDESEGIGRDLGIPDEAPFVNPKGGAIAIGHPLGASGARLVTTAVHELERRIARHALCTMCIGVGQGIAMVVERV